MKESRPRILVVDDEPDLRDLLTASLGFAGYDAVAVASGRQALDHLAEQRTDLVVMDIMMPTMDGLTTVRRLRSRGDEVPVLFLTARDSADDVVKGLEVGGDDYVTKPFSLAEVVARIGVILKRTRAATQTDLTLRVGDLTLDDDAHEARRGERVLDLTPTEFSVLRLLMMHPGKVLSKAQILEHVWGWDTDTDETIVETYISYLRRKIDAGETPALIATKRGVGYLLKVTP